MVFVSDVTLIDGDRELPFWDHDYSWVEVSLRNGVWAPHFNIVEAKGFPATKTDWGSPLLLRSDSNCNHHVLITSRWDPSYMNYIVKDDEDWSAPLILGNVHKKGGHISLAVSDTGVVFAAWVNEKGKFVGRWIKQNSYGQN